MAHATGVPIDAPLLLKATRSLPWQLHSRPRTPRVLGSQRGADALPAPLPGLLPGTRLGLLPRLHLIL